MASKDAHKVYVAPIRAELETLAALGTLTYYKDLGAIVGKPARWTLWKTILDEIGCEKPDLTIIVLNAKTGWPSQIGYKATGGKPSVEQKEFAQGELARVFQKYCPSRPVPKFPVKRKSQAS